jgi:hypothetical protein
MSLSFRFLTLLSCLAYCVLCAVLAAFCLRAKVRVLLKRAPDGTAQPAPEQPAQGGRLPLSLASCAALAAFLALPPGSLPALLSCSWGALAVLGCLALASGLAGAWSWNGATRRQARVLAFLALSLALFAWYGQQRGAPGEIFSLDWYVTAPLANLMGWGEGFGVLLLALALLLALRDVQQDLASSLARATRLEPDEARLAVASALVRQIWILAVLGMAVCLFVPFSPAGRLGMSGVTGTAVDALWFWLKILIADHALWLGGMRLPQLSLCRPWGQMLIAGFGALCLLFA